MKKTKNKERLAGPVLAAVLAVLTCAVVTTPAVARAVATPPQQRGVPVLRTVQGHVQNKASAPLNGAVVYLKDTKTLAVKSFIADDGGNFHFGQLNQTTDYEVYAESNGKRSNVKKISSFDNHNSFDFTLTVPTDK